MALSPSLINTGSVTTFDLHGRTAVVTGGGTHIGRAIAATLARAGASVHIVGRRRGPIDAATQDLTSEGLSCWGHTGDVSDEDTVERLLDKILDGKPLDVLVANAGGRGGYALAPDIGMAQWWETFRLNVGTAAVSAQAAARRMREGGRIVLLGSIHGILGADSRTYGHHYRPSGSDYHAAKGAVVNLTRSLACALGAQGITVNCISPGQIPPANADPETVELFRQASPLGVVGRPQDVAGVALLLASPAGRFITGQNIVVDGGWSAW